MMEKRRRNPQESSIGTDIEFANEDFDFDSRKKDSKLYQYALFAALLIACTLFYFSGKTPTFSQLGESGGSKFNPIELQTATITVRTAIRSLPSNSMKNITIPVAVIQETAEQIEEKSRNIESYNVIATRLMTALNKKCQRLIEDARQLKQRGVIMENDPIALKLIALLQEDLRTLLKMRFGEKPKLLVDIVLKFPKSMADYNTEGAFGKIRIELAPVDIVPYSVYYWLEIIRRFKAGAFHRNAGHVLQAMISLEPPSTDDHFIEQGLAFQEYSPLFPHEKLTLGFAGRPGGGNGAFYISTIDNTQNHGPASQGSKTEADSCFGKVVSDEKVIERMKKQPGQMPGSGFVAKTQNFIQIWQISLLNPDLGRDIGGNASIVKRNRNDGSVY
jgi:hypothetical protein